MKNTRSKTSKRPFILAVSAAALLAGLLPARASLLLDPTGGTVLFSDAAGHDDQSSSGRALGFTGNYFGTPHTTVDVITNGNLNFSANTTFSNAALGPGIARIAPLWDDLDINIGNGASLIETKLPGAYYAATWVQIENFPSSVTRQTFQAAWFGAATTLRGFTFLPDDLVFSYVGPIQPFQGNSATVGLNSGTGAAVPVPGTTNGLLSAATANLLPAAADGGFLLFRPDGAGSYTPYVAAPVLQNSGPVGMPTDANFIVVENATTGSSSESNTIGSVLFAEGAKLRVFNTLTVTRAYTQSATGTLQLSLSGPTSFDKVVVGGAAVLDGTLEVSYGNGFVPKRGQTFEVLTAAGGVSGEFDEVLDPLATPLLGLDAIYASNAVVLTVVQRSFEDVTRAFGGTPNQVATARALDSVAFGTTVPEFIDYLDAQPLADLPGNLDRIAPEELTSIFAISTALEQVQAGNLQRRMDDLRRGASGFSAAGLAMQGTGPGYSGQLAGLAGPSGKDGKDLKETKLTMAEAPRWGAFLTGVGEWVDVGTTDYARGYQITTGGFTLGLDYRVCSNFAIGISAGYAGTGANLTDDGRVWVNGGQIGLYATTFIGGWYADLAVNGGYNSYDTKRSALEGTARGSTEGGELNVLFGTGYDWKAGALTIGVTATYSYTLAGIESFTERGSLAPLKIHNRNAESVRTAFGLKASYDWKVAGMLVRPELRVAWQHEYGDSSYGLDASFANGGGDGFLVNGPTVGRDSVLIGAGFAIQLNDRWSTYVYYDAEFGREEYERQGVSGGLRIAF